MSAIRNTKNFKQHSFHVLGLNKIPLFTGMFTFRFFSAKQESKQEHSIDNSAEKKMVELTSSQLKTLDFISKNILVDETDDAWSLARFLKNILLNISKNFISILLSSIPFAWFFFFGGTYKITWYVQVFEDLRTLPLLIPPILCIVFSAFGSVILNRITVSFALTNLGFLRIWRTENLLDDVFISIPSFVQIKKILSEQELMEIGITIYRDSQVPANLPFIKGLVENKTELFSLADFKTAIYNNIVLLTTEKSKLILQAAEASSASNKIWWIVGTALGTFFIHKTLNYSWNYFYGDPRTDLSSLNAKLENLESRIDDFESGEKVVLLEDVEALQQALATQIIRVEQISRILRAAGRHI